MNLATRDCRLALGTVQFGVAYGVAGRGEPVPESEVSEILRRARDLGIDTLDTAASYGSIEGRLGRLMGDLEFRVISKLPALPRDLSSAETVELAVQAFERSKKHLGKRLKALMFHNASDLALPAAAAVWDALRTRAEDDGIALGVSCYEPETLTALAKRFDLRIAQLPGNALDQRVRTDGTPTSVEIHLRSLFLQGLLLMPLEAARRRVPAAGEALQRWHNWCSARSLSPLQAALCVVKIWPTIDRYVVGVDNLAQLEQIADQWESARPMAADELATQLPDAIDPRRWPATEAA